MPGCAMLLSNAKPASNPPLRVMYESLGFSRIRGFRLFGVMDDLLARHWHARSTPGA
jgi:hypothetical protein